MNLNDIAISAKVLYDKNPDGGMDCYVSVELANGRQMAIIPEDLESLESDEEKIEAALEMEGKTLIEDFEYEVNER
jgi:hypothetical protein